MTSRDGELTIAFSAEREALVSEEAVSVKASGLSRRRSSWILPLGLLLVAAMAGMAHWAGIGSSPAEADTRASVSYTLVEPATRISVTRTCTVFKGNGDWTPIGVVHQSEQVVANGAAHTIANVEVQPIKAKVSADGISSPLPGEVQATCLAQPAQAQSGAKPAPPAFVATPQPAATAPPAVVAQPVAPPPPPVVNHLLEGQHLPDHCTSGADFAEAQFNCLAGYQDWGTGWSVEKQQYCCEVCRVACKATPLRTPPPKVWDVTTPEGPTYQETTTLTSTTSLVDLGADTFDCDAGKENAEKGWSVWKKRWCCTHESKGCGLKGAIAGNFRLKNVNYEDLPKETVLEKQLFQAVKESIKEIANSQNETVGVQIRDILLEYWEAPSEGGYGKDSEVEAISIRFAIKPHDNKQEVLIRERVTCRALTKEVPKEVNALPNIEKVTSDKYGWYNEVKLTHCTVDLALTKVPCVCPHGEAATGDTCPGDGSHICTNCEYGYMLTGAETCEANVCSCSNGIGTVGAGCKASGTESCGFCDVGFHFEKGGSGFVCVLNDCTCKHGTPTAFQACKLDKSNTCGKCDRGYHLNMDSFHCEKNSCYCKNGVAPDHDKQLEQCEKDHSQVCTRCNIGYYLHHIENICKPNTCHCDDGTAAVGKACIENGEEVCVSCNHNEYLTPDNTCGHKKCICPNGTAVEDLRCSTNRGTICQACDKGFYMPVDTKQCVPEGCHCEGGTPASDCTKHRPCGSCFAGHRLLQGKCVANTCSCDHGAAATGKVCQKDGLELCTSCKEGYHPETSIDEITHLTSVRCEGNVCTCKNGPAAKPVTSAVAGHNGNICHMDKREICTSCQQGFHMDPDHICRIDTCSCLNGTPLTGTRCRSHGSVDCGECIEGYHLSHEGGTHMKHSRSCVADGATQMVFDCKAGYGKRMLGWSLLKKDWCCRNKGVACRFANDTQKEACDFRYTRSECDIIGCCGNFDTAPVGCKPKSEQEKNDICSASRLFELRGSPNYCLASYWDYSVPGAHEAKMYALSCNEQNPLSDRHHLTGNRQSWIWEQTVGTGWSGRLRMWDLSTQCLQVEAATAPESLGAWHAVKIVTCSQTGQPVPDGQKWETGFNWKSYCDRLASTTAIDSSSGSTTATTTPIPVFEVRFAATVGTEVLCLGVKAGEAEVPGAEIVARKCEPDKKRDAGQDWMVPRAALKSPPPQPPIVHVCGQAIHPLR